MVLVVKNPLANTEHMRHGFNPWVRRIPWGGNGNPLQYHCMENPMDRGAWGRERWGLHSIELQRVGNN